MSELIEKLSMNKIKICHSLILAFSGGVIYFYMEILCRGYSHISMFFCAGGCFVILGRIGEGQLKEGVTWKSLYHVSIIGAALISVIEFVTGVLVNIILGLDVWDYSEIKYNVLGQICPTYTCLWGLISIPAVYLYMLIRMKIFQENKKSPSGQ